ncbi:hypothetical protein Tco_0005838 [Tanacetum coccineum]
MMHDGREGLQRQDMAKKEVSTADLVTTAGEVVTTANVEVSTASPTTAKITNVELTLAQTLDKVKTDYELAQRLQAEEQEELTIEEISKLFQQLLEKRRKHFAAKSVKERRNRPPTKAQQRSIMCTYLKNIAGWKPKDLKTKSFANVQELFDKSMKRTREESSSKRAGDELEQEPSKKQKMEDDKETSELQSERNSCEIIGI